MKWLRKLLSIVWLVSSWLYGMWLLFVVCGVCVSVFFLLSIVYVMYYMVLSSVSIVKFVC